MNLSKKQQFSKFPLFILGIVILGLNSCFYKLGDLPSFPKVTTESTVSNIQSSSATSGGSVTDDAGTPIIARGVCWSTKVDPTVEDSITKDGSGKGLFTSYLKNLIPNTIYFVRAYASSTVGYYFYGQTVRFKTNDLSTVSTDLIVSEITATTANVGGTVLGNNSDPVIAKGVCWSTRINPTLNDSLTINGPGPGGFESKLTNLSENTTYFVRAYATSNNVTVYGDAIGFQTRKLPNVTTVSNVINIKYSSATSGGIVILDGGEIITKRGVCWNTIPNPTINDSITSDGTGLGIYSSNLSNLNPNTKYYVRAYATSIAGTSYGINEVTFTTAELVTDIDGNAYDVVSIGTQKWMVENLKTTRFNDGTAIPLVKDQVAWANLSTPGYCWFNNDPTISNHAYGALYNWYTVSTSKLAPIGWHVPTDDDWTTLSTFVGGNGGKLKEAGIINWATPNTGATNVTNFSALPSGSRGNNDGTFISFGQYSFWWSSTAQDNTFVYFRILSYNNSNIDKSSSRKVNGFAVRCIKD